MRAEVLAATTLMILTGVGQAAPPQTIQSGVQAVEVDVVVLDRDGRPVRGLGPQDFELFADGRPVRIAVFAAPDPGAGTRTFGRQATDESGSTFAGKEQPSQGDVFVVVLDDFTMRFDIGRLVKAKQVVRALVEKLDASDRVAVVATSGRQELLVEFTADHKRVLDAVERLLPFGEDALCNDPSERHKAAATIEVLRDVAAGLGALPRRRKVIMLVSEGIRYPIENEFLAWYQDLLTTLSRANAVVYTFDVAEVRVPQSLGQLSLRMLAENSGGRATVNTNAVAQGVDRLLRDSSAAYILGFYPEGPGDDTLHPLKMRVRRPGVEVRARRAYFAPRPHAGRPPGEDPLARLITARPRTPSSRGAAATSRHASSAGSGAPMSWSCWVASAKTRCLYAGSTTSLPGCRTASSVDTRLGRG